VIWIYFGVKILDSFTTFYKLTFMPAYLRHSAQTQAFVDIFKSMGDDITAFVQKLDP
jgi:hypothetical protein